MLFMQACLDFKPFLMDRLIMQQLGEPVPCYLEMIFDYLNSSKVVCCQMVLT